MLVKLIVATLATSAFAKSNHNKEAWDLRNDPSIFGVSINQPFEALPARASLAPNQRPWSGHYWPHNQGGIANRWQYARSTDPNSHPYLFRFMSAEEIMRLDSRSLGWLSPAEKYDIYTGRFDLPLTRLERASTLGSGDGSSIPGWHGICHGWAPASYMEPSPGDKVDVRLSDGRILTFYAADLQALLSKIYGRHPTTARYLGGRCNNQDVEFDSDGRVTAAVCRDVNPGALHLLLADHIGRRQKTFIADIDIGEQVWNHPVVGYAYKSGPLRRATDADPAAAHRARGTAFLVDIDLTLTVAAGARPTRRVVPPQTHAYAFKYTLELDQNRRVIGGEWLSRARPDFLWEPTAKPRGVRDGLDYDIVADLVRQSLQGSTPSPAEPSILNVQRWEARYGVPNSRLTVTASVSGEGWRYVRLLRWDGAQYHHMGAWNVRTGQAFRVTAPFPFQTTTYFLLEVFDEQRRQRLDWEGYKIR